VLELYLLIAMKRLEEKERDKYNFQMVFAGPHEPSAVWPQFFTVRFAASGSPQAGLVDPAPNGLSTVFRILGLKGFQGSLCMQADVDTGSLLQSLGLPQITSLNSCTDWLCPVTALERSSACARRGEIGRYFETQHKSVTLDLLKSRMVFSSTGALWFPVGFFLT
jgi:hypothetical protein